jgi:Mg2+-importing ATPase
MNDGELADATNCTTVFAKLTPTQKERIVRALHVKGRVVGFLGDVINDSPALKATDVGISVRYRGGYRKGVGGHYPP